PRETGQKRRRRRSGIERAGFTPMVSVGGFGPSGDGLPRTADQPFRREDPAEYCAHRYAIPFGDLPDRMALNEVIDKNSAIKRRYLPQCASKTRTGFRALQ